MTTNDEPLVMCSNRGVDTAIEAVGIPATFELCEQIVAPGGTIAVRAHKIDPARLITHHFKLAGIIDAADTFGEAAKTGAPKVIIEA